MKDKKAMTEMQRDFVAKMKEYTLEFEFRSPHGSEMPLL